MGLSRSVTSLVELTESEIGARGGGEGPSYMQNGGFPPGYRRQTPFSACLRSSWDQGLEVWPGPPLCGGKKNSNPPRAPSSSPSSSHQLGKHTSQFSSLDLCPPPSSDPFLGAVAHNQQKQ